DRFAFRLLGYRIHRPAAAAIVPSAPIRAGARGTAVVGDQPVEIRAGETVIAQWTDRPAPWIYSEAPWRYFRELTDRFFLPITVVRVAADAGRLDAVIAEARARGAAVIAARVGKAASMEEAVRDAEALTAWLGEHPAHRAVLFHSAAYEPGYRLFARFPRQTTFGDIDPVIRMEWRL
ncbi:MAG: hypothetical protein K6W08_13630, partial [Firmicutes bacterium]|nr:hypothetical protein [Bacillota bacterium]